MCEVSNTDANLSLANAFMINTTPAIDAHRLSAIGPKRTSLVALHMSSFGGKADITFCDAHVRF